MDKIKDELKAYIHNKQFVKEQLEEIEERKELLYKTTTILSDLPKGTADVGSIQEKIANLIDLTRELEKTIHDMEENQIKIESKINKLEQPYALILYKMYIQGKTLVTVASEMNYNYKYVCRIHGEALQKYSEIK